MCSSVLELISLCISHICGISTYTIWNIELLLVIVEIVACHSYCSFAIYSSYGVEFYYLQRCNRRMVLDIYVTPFMIILFKRRYCQEALLLVLSI